MDDHELWTRRFDEHRARLLTHAYRMLGSHADAEDAVQEAWLRVSRVDRSTVTNPAGWLTTIVARVCLNMLESRRTRREDPAGELPPEPGPGLPGNGQAAPVDPEGQVVLADSVGVALSAVLDSLSPAERLAFVLHDVFDVPFPEIGELTDRSPAAVRQLASRARRRVREAAADSEITRTRKYEVVTAFFAAARAGDFTALLAVLDPDAVLVADPAAVTIGAAPQVQGAQAVATVFAGRAQGARPALVDGVPAAVWNQRGKPRVVFTFTVVDGRITDIDLVGDEERLARLDIRPLAVVGLD